MGILTYMFEVTAPNESFVAIIHYNLVYCDFSIGERMFIKHGDGKILSVVEDEELTEQQKKAARDLSKKVVKQSEETDTSEVKKSGS